MRCAISERAVRFVSSSFGFDLVEEALEIISIGYRRADRNVVRVPRASGFVRTFSRQGCLSATKRKLVRYLLCEGLGEEGSRKRA